MRPAARPVTGLLALSTLCLAGGLGACDRPAADHLGEPATETTSSAAASDEFSLSSPAFDDNSTIPTDFSCSGRNVPPPLHWRNVPTQTQSLALVVDDPDAPAGLYVHWVVTGIPADVTEITAGVLPASAVVSLNSSNRAEYLGPCPPSGSGVHHYRFKLYALSSSPGLTVMTPATESTTVIAGQSLAVAETVGLLGK